MGTGVKLGSGSFTYEVIEGWEKLPDGYAWRDATDAVVDSKDRVYISNRGSGEHPILVFDTDGNYLDTIGAGVFPNPHALTLGPDDTIYCTDTDDHTVRQFSSDGKLLLTIGTPGKSAPPHSGKPFNRCCQVAVDPRNGDLFVADGYRNSSVHKFSPDGKHLLSWGGPGTDPGEFNIPHAIETDKDGNVYVADRENSRVQIFDSEGKYLTQWNNINRPCGIYISNDQLVYIGELGWANNVSREVPNIGPRIAILNTKGERLARLGDQGYGTEVGQFVAPHGIAVDSRGDIYLGEVAHTSLNSHGAAFDGVRTFQKLVKVG